ncbi:MAG: IS66 family transposase [Gammaproteobacteria bacterium]|nr:IS66 family transposase [Gammaproteobacteria bacterium]MBU1723632.1 IS66 family transposase [Gammaproteobacteria bacterium]MBU2005628.1 IS66 family transposase [Gammaproteobacteria bacterium]
MNLAPPPAPKTTSHSDLDAARLRQLLAQQEAEFAAVLKQRDHYIQLLEEMLRLAKIQRFSAQSEKLPFQIDLFDEAELATALEDIAGRLPEAEPARPSPSQRQRGFPPGLKRQRVELLLSDAEKAGATRTFFTKVKEELDYIPAQLVVLEYWQEKAVFAAGASQDPAPATADGGPTLVAAARPPHPLGKCHASLNLLTQVIIAKYADGLPLYRLEGIFKRHGAELSRSSMAHWIIRLEDSFKPLLNLLRETQNSGAYLQGDETRIQVLKEDGKTAQADKWMWVVRGGPPNQVAVLFEYGPSRAGSVPERLLMDFHGIFQADGYSGYAAVCRNNAITRIGCWDHARRKFVEAVKAAGGKQARGKPTLADIALGMIRRLYRIEDNIKGLDTAEKYRLRQQLSVPLLNELKTWLETQVGKVMKGGLTRKAMEYCLNQWEYLSGYCQRGDLHISNVLAENAIRPFAVGRKAWLFADTPHGARASAACYSLIETAKANDLEPYAYIRYLLEHIAQADTLEKWEALLPWNVPLEKCAKKVPFFDKGK